MGDGDATVEPGEAGTEPGGAGSEPGGAGTERSEAGTEQGEAPSGRDEARSERAKASSVCPECATPRSERTPMAPWAVRHRLKLKFAALLLVLGFVVWQNVRTPPVMTPPAAFTGGGVQFPAHRYTRADLRAYASGTNADGQLFDDLFYGSILVSYQLEVALIDPAGERMSGTVFGWPTSIASYSWQADYDDVYAKTNPVATVYGFTSRWRGLLYYANRLDEQGRFEAFSFNARELAVPLFLVVAAFSVGRALRCILVALHAGTRDGKRARDRWLRRMPALFATVSAIGVAAWSLQPRSVLDSMRPTATKPTLVRLGLTGTDFARLSDEPNAAAAVATALLEALAENAQSPDHVLAFRLRIEQDMTYSFGFGGWPVNHFYSTIESTAWPTGDKARRPHYALTRDGSAIAIAARWGDPLERFDRLEFTPISLALIGFMLYGAWWTVAVAVWLVAWKARRLSVKRSGHGQCARCGYDLTGL